MQSTSTLTILNKAKTIQVITMAQAPPFIYNGELTYKPHYFKGFRIAVEMQGMNKYFTDPQNTATVQWLYCV